VNLHNCGKKSGTGEQKSNLLNYRKNERSENKKYNLQKLGEILVQ